VGSVSPLIKSRAEVIKRHAIDKPTLAAGSENSYELWCEVQAACMTKLLGFGEIAFASPDRFFRNLTFRDIHDRADHFFVA
jgi:hypothetical protein